MMQMSVVEIRKLRLPATKRRKNCLKNSKKRVANQGHRPGQQRSEKKPAKGIFAVLEIANVPFHERMALAVIQDEAATPVRECSDGGFGVAALSSQVTQLVEQA